MFDRATADRLEQARKEDVANRLTIQDLNVGSFGVVGVVVDQIQPTRTFQRKNGGEGTFTKVVVQDETGEVELVFWGDEWAKVQPAIVPQANIRLCGFTVKEGFRGGIELHLGNGHVEAVGSSDETLRGTLTSIGPVQPLQHPPPHVKRCVTLQTSREELELDLFDDASIAAVDMVGLKVEIGPVHPHPLLEGRFIAIHARIQKQ